METTTTHDGTNLHDVADQIEAFAATVRTLAIITGDGMRFGRDPTLVMELLKDPGQMARNVETLTHSIADALPLLESRLLAAAHAAERLTERASKGN